MALETPRNTIKLYSDQQRVLPVAAGTMIFQGSLVAIDDGFAVPASADAGIIPAGRAETGADNRVGAAGDVTVEVLRGIFAWENDPAAPVTQALVGKDAYVLDDQTVSASDGAGTRPVAGMVYQIDAAGIWIETR